MQLRDSHTSVIIAVQEIIVVVFIKHFQLLYR